VHLTNVVNVLREKYPKDRLHILVAERNSGYFTYDGIETGGERVCQEIEEEIEKLAREGQTIKKLSIVGYSLGGLVSRYAIGLLYSKGFFEKIAPVVSISERILDIRPWSPSGISLIVYRTSLRMRARISASELHYEAGVAKCLMCLVPGLFQCLADSCSSSTTSEKRADLSSLSSQTKIRSSSKDWRCLRDALYMPISSTIEVQSTIPRLSRSMTPLQT
jgi:hypothetical protein